jgi:tetratricopeptide (TPR) repeat protein
VAPRRHDLPGLNPEHPLQLILETWKPLDESAIWRLHDAYFAQRGVAAWHEGEVPSYSTSNYQAAIQHVDFFVRVVEGLPAARRKGPFHILEVGSGHGAFAVNFLRALDAHPSGGKLAGAVRYLMTDYSARGLDEACALPEVAPLVAAGRIVPALFDLRTPEVLTLRDGGAPPRAFDLVISNYVTCVLPLKNLQKRGKDWYEQHVSIVLRRADDAPPEAPEDALARILADATASELLGESLRLQFDWRRRGLARIYEDQDHRAVLTTLTSRWREATVGYPHGFLDFMRAFAGRLAPHGCFLINDYGGVVASEFEGLEERRPEFYGNSLANSVNFAIFDAVADTLGWGVLRTRAPEEILHSAVLRPGGTFSAAEASAFDASYVSRRGCDDVLDFWTAAHRLASDKDLDASLRFWSRLIRLEPHHTEHYLRAGEVAIDAGRLELARALLERGKTLGGTDLRFDFDFQLGRTYCLLGLNDLAIAAYQASLEVDPHAVTFTNLGVLLEEAGEHRRAFRAYRAALAADPADARPRERLAGLRDRLWHHTLEAWEGPDVVDPLAEPPPDDAETDDPDEDPR